MNFSVLYSKDFKYHDRDDIEYLIMYNEHDEGVFDFLKQIAPKEVSICFKNKKQIENFFAEDKIKLYQQSEMKNFKFRIPIYNDNSRVLGEKFQASQIRFYYEYAVNNWDELDYILSLGVSDVIASGEICFHMASLSKVVHNHGVKLRIYANIAQGNSNENNIRDFFIRPNDLLLYNNFVDTIEMFYNGVNDISFFYKIYAIQKEWFGDLTEIITDLNTPFDNKSGNAITFGEFRLNCGKKCQKGSPCRICETTAAYANKLNENNIILK